jgi:beta-phosphoglucomutase-like phosphatase (HAD superfamily)
MSKSPGMSAIEDRFRSVIFDCDGVLVDGEIITNRVFVGMLNELGLKLSLDDMFERFVGRSMPQCLALIAQLLGREVPDELSRHPRQDANDTGLDRAYAAAPSARGGGAPYL